MEFYLSSAGALRDIHFLLHLLPMAAGFMGLHCSYHRNTCKFDIFFNMFPRVSLVT